MTSSYNPTITQGIDWIFTTTVTGVDITGYTVSLQIRSQSDNSVIQTITNGSGITLTTPLSGIATYRVTGAQTALINYGPYNFGIKATSPGGIAYDWVDGVVTIGEVRVA